MEDKKESWVFCYWDEPIDIKKEKNKPEDKNEKDDIH